MPPSPLLFRRRLLSWFARHGRRDLPWRGDPDPAHVLVSEFMLQQTTVAAVLPYYRRFLRSFPTLKRLAKAPLERVLELWSGLGYYSRARNLHATARILVARHGGRIPETREEAEALPGVGPYTAGALLSFAYDKPEALVDGNAARVLARIYGVEEETGSSRLFKRAWALARRLVPPSGARDFNAALMDLGSLVCRAAAPDCPACPFRRSCRARAAGRQEAIPGPKPERARPQVVLHAGLLRRRGRWLLTRRPPGGLYGGLWEFPSVELPEGAPRRYAEEALSRRLGTDVSLERRRPPVSHILSHRELRIVPWIGRARAAGPSFRWFRKSEISGLAASSLTRKLSRFLMD